MNTESPTILVTTGATGLTGSAIVREFARHKHSVRALVRNRAKVGSDILHAMPTVDFVSGDISQPNTLDLALEGINRVLMISSANPQMREMQCAFVEACKKRGVRHVVKFSGAESGIGFDPTTDGRQEGREPWHWRELGGAARASLERG